MKYQEVTGIILAGGASKRMGKDKGLCDFKGKPLVQHSINILEPICKTILISTNNNSGYKQFGFETVGDEFRNIGPIGGIYSSLKQSPNNDNLVISCDTPFLDGDLLKTVLSFRQSYDIVVPQYRNSYFEPLAAYYSREIIPVLLDSISKKDYKLINLFEKVRFRSVSIDADAENINRFKNINTPKDLKA